MAEKLDGLVEKYDCILARRGKGLLLGLALAEDTPAGDIVAKCLEEGLVAITAGGNVLRFAPPLIIKKEHVDEMIEKLEACLI